MSEEEWRLKYKAAAEASARGPIPRLAAEIDRLRAEMVERDENAARLIDALTQQRDMARAERDALRAALVVALEAERDALRAAIDEAGRIATSALTCPDYDEPTDAANAYAAALARIRALREKARTPARE